MTSNIINMSDKANDARMQSPETCLRDCLENDIGKQRAFKSAKKLIIIALDDTKDQYDTSWNQAGLKASEMISLLETIKNDVYFTIRGEG